MYKKIYYCLIISICIFNVSLFAEGKIETTALIQDSTRVEKKMVVSYSDNKLSITANRVTLEELCEEISDKAKIEIVLDKEVKVQKISVEFKNLSLKEGIERILDLTGLKDLAISWKEKENVGVNQELPKYEISKVEIHKRLKEGMVKTENTEKKEIKHENNKEKSHFVKTDKKIELFNSKGEVLNLIELKREEKSRKVEKNENSKIIQYEEVDVKEVSGKVSGNGKYAGILTLEAIHTDENVKSTSTVVKYLDSNNEVLFEKPNVYMPLGTQISQDGSRLAFVEVKFDLNMSPPINDLWIVVYDKNGKELFRLGSYIDASTIFLTKNGKYGYFVASTKSTSGINSAFLCFNVDTGEMYTIDYSLVGSGGWIYLSEDGEVIVEKGRKVHVDGQIERGEIVLRYKFK